MLTWEFTPRNHGHLEYLTIAVVYFVPMVVSLLDPVKLMLPKVDKKLTFLLFCQLRGRKTQMFHFLLPLPLQFLILTLCHSSTLLHAHTHQRTHVLLEFLRGGQNGTEGRPSFDKVHKGAPSY